MDKNSEDPEDSKCDETQIEASKLESSTIAKIDTSSKKFQAQVHRLKILKGLGEQNP